MAIVALGGRVAVVDGVAEFHGGMAARSLARLVPRCRFGAITFGHVIIGRSAEVLAELRAHEQAHVRQYERWGVMFVPAYVASSSWQWWRGGEVHADNHFERAARAEAR